MSFAEPALDEDPPLAFSAAANPERADKFFAGTGHSIAAILALANEGKPLPRFAIPAKIRARVKFETAGLESQNVAGLLRGTDSRLRDEYVVLTAHLDHLGVGRPINGDSIYNGAMDNASGVATLIETARLLQAPGRRPLSRSVLFVAVTGEEKGMLGSRYFALRPTVEGRDIVANLNVDMFMPFYALKLLTVMGVDESTLGDEARAVAARLGLEVEADPEPQRNRFIRSDQYSFIRRGVPALAFKVGYAKDSPEAAIARKWLAERYHAPSDDLEQPVDRQAATDFNRFYAALVEAVANRPSRPKWREASFFRRFAKR
jgi:Zn-dependent M28 family amino/carboxypeptidase